jgi:predicted GNAT family acetyltransferase
MGTAGVVIEGVYTWPLARGKGYASGLVAAVAATALVDHPLVCLHVAADNHPARRAYARCGMVDLGECQLMLRE